MRIIFTFLLFSICINSHAQIPSYVPTNGLVGWWPFNGNANDESGNGNHGTVNGATLTTDRFGNVGKAYFFNGNGSNNKITVFNPINLPVGNQSRTISLWINTNSTYWGRFILVYGTNRFCTMGTGTNGGGDINYLGAIGIGTYPLQIIFPNQWINIVAVYNSSNSTSFIYSNGVQVFAQQNITLDNDFGDLLFGIKHPSMQTNPGDDYIWLGKIDDIAIYSRALTQQEITQLYTGTVVPNTPEDTTSNVGIGTTTPKRKLHVNDVMRLEPRDTAPANPAKGDIYFDGVLNKIRYYNGTTWVNL